MCSRCDSKQGKHLVNERLIALGKVKAININVLKEGVAKWAFPRGGHSKALPKGSAANWTPSGTNWVKQDKIDLEEVVSPELRKKIEDLFSGEKKDDLEVDDSSPKQGSGDSGSLLEKYLELCSEDEDEEKNYGCGSIYQNREDEIWPYESLLKQEVNEVDSDNGPVIEPPQDPTSVRNSSSYDSLSLAKQLIGDHVDNENLTCDSQQDKTTKIDCDEGTSKEGSSSSNACQESSRQRNEKLQVQSPTNSLQILDAEIDFNKNANLSKEKVERKRNKQKATQGRGFHSNKSKKENVNTNSVKSLENSVVLRLFRAYTETTFKKQNPEFQLFPQFEDNANIEEN